MDTAETVQARSASQLRRSAGFARTPSTQALLISHIDREMNRSTAPLPIRLSRSLALAALALAASAAAAAAEPLPRALPEAEGVASTDVLSFLDAVADAHFKLNSIMIARHGHVVAEGWWSPATPNTRQDLQSVAKSFTSMAAGLAVAEGKLHLDDRVVDILSDRAPAKPGEHLAALRLRDLLTMTSGRKVNTGYGTKDPEHDDWIRCILDQPLEYPPGTHFKYAGSCAMLVSAMVQKATGENLQTYLKPRLFDPLGIEGFEWELSPQGMNKGSGGLQLTTEDLAKFGQLCLQQGSWHGRQLVPAEWIREATKAQVVDSRFHPGFTDNEQGYGYYFWRSRHNGYWAFGSGSQICLVLPDLDAVIVVTALEGNTPKVMDTIWDKLLPAFRDGKLPNNPESDADLNRRLASLERHP